MKIFSEFTNTVSVNGVTYDVRGRHREWNPLPPYLAPNENGVWEVFVNYRGADHCAVGDNRQEALSALVRLLSRMDAWYQNPNRDNRLSQ